ncbi:TPA: lytic transglycosylase domain-containing protein [Pseudomonas aeruginosa]
MQKLPKFALTLLVAAGMPALAMAEQAQPMRFSELASKCAPTVHPSTLKALIGNESTFNPYAIGVVGTHLKRQPQSLNEAIATAEQLEREGKRYAMGLGQLLVTNMRAKGMDYNAVFEPCRNLQAISDLLVEYYKQALTTSSDKQEALLKAFSMYYSGNELRGFKPDRPGEMSYVEKVVDRALNPTAEDPIVPAVEGAESAEPISVVSHRLRHEKPLSALVEPHSSRRGLGLPSPTTTARPWRRASSKARLPVSKIYRCS